jgi:hypothetical protein
MDSHAELIGKFEGIVIELTLQNEGRNRQTKKARREYDELRAQLFRRLAGHAPAETDYQVMDKSAGK